MRDESAYCLRANRLFETSPKNLSTLSLPTRTYNHIIYPLTANLSLSPSRKRKRIAISETRLLIRMNNYNVYS